MLAADFQEAAVEPPLSRPTQRLFPGRSARKARVQNRGSPARRDIFGPLEELVIDASSDLGLVETFIDSGLFVHRKWNGRDGLSDAVRRNRDSASGIGEKSSNRALARSDGSAEENEFAPFPGFDEFRRETGVLGRTRLRLVSLSSLDHRLLGCEAGDFRANKCAVGLIEVDNREETVVVARLCVGGQERIGEISPVPVFEVHREERHLGSGIDPSEIVVELEAVDDRRIRRIVLEPDVIEM